MLPVVFFFFFLALFHCSKDEKLFFALIKAAFSQRRKTVLNSISSGMGVAKADVERALADSGISLTARAEQLELSDFAKIADNL